jgi:hypothetical protein
MLARRRRSKLIAFVIAEAAAFGVFFLSTAIELALKPTDLALMLFVDMVTMMAAPAVFIMVFFTIRPVLPRSER